MISEGSIRSIRALVVDDHAVTRSGIRLLLEQLEGVDVVGEAGSAEEAIGLQRELAPDLVLMDLNMPRMNGIEATRAMRSAEPGVHVLVLSVHEDEATILESLHAGAVGYLPKSCDFDELEEAIRTVCREDGVYISPAVTARVMRSAVRPGGGPGGSGASGSITAREREILHLLAEGLTARSIGSRLSISERTVNTHVGNLYRRLGVNNRVDAVIVGMRQGLLELPQPSNA